MKRHEHADENCLALFEKLSEYLDNELDSATCEEIERHIRGCAPCGVCLETLRRTVALCRSMPPETAPQSLSRRLQELMRQRDAGIT